MDDDEDAAKRHFANPKATVEKLDSLWKKVDGVRLDNGVGYHGWIAFEFTDPTADPKKKIMRKIRLIDALGGIHPVFNGPNDVQFRGRIRHSKKGLDK